MKRPLSSLPLIGLAFLSVSYFSTLQAETPKGADQTAAKEAKKPKLAHVYRNAHILSHGGQHTVVPLRSIIHLPAKDKKKVVELPSGKFRFWPQFFKTNQSWLWTYEVTLEQVKGIKPIPAEKIEEFRKLNRTVIATYRKNPISVRAVKPKTENEAENKSTP